MKKPILRFVVEGLDDITEQTKVLDVTLKIDKGTFRSLINYNSDDEYQRKIAQDELYKDVLVPALCSLSNMLDMKIIDEKLEKCFEE